MLQLNVVLSAQYFLIGITANHVLCKITRRQQNTQIYAPNAFPVYIKNNTQRAHTFDAYMTQHTRRTTHAYPSRSARRARNVTRGAARPTADRRTGLASERRPRGRRAVRVLGAAGAAMLHAGGCLRFAAVSGEYGWVW